MEDAILTQTLDAAQKAEKFADNLLSQYDLNDIESLRRKRLKELKQRAEKEANWKLNGHGKYIEIGDEKEWFDCCKNSERVITHFYRTSTWRCQIVDKHFEILARRHIETKFIKINAEKCNFLAQRLEIVLLPTIICTLNNLTHDRIEGFDDLGGIDTFSTGALEKRLAKNGMIEYDESSERFREMKMSKSGTIKNVADNPNGLAIYQSRQQELNSDEDSD